MRHSSRFLQPLKTSKTGRRSHYTSKKIGTSNYIFYLCINYKLNVMPELCRFFGIIIAMFGDDHNPPHFHVRYGDYEAIITIEDGIVKGELPKKVLKDVFRWMDLHQEELEMNWKRLQEGKEIIKIKPLI